MSTGDPLAKVTPGQPLRIPAAAYNAFVDAAVDLRMRQQRGGGAESAGRRRESGLVLVRNDSGGDLARFSVATVSGVAISPVDNLLAFQNGPVLLVGAPVAGAPVVVLQEPIANGKCGVAMLAGVTPVLVAVNDVGHTCCDAVADDTDRLHTVAAGPVRLVWTAGSSGDQWSVVALGHGAASAGGVQPVKLTAKTNDTTYTGDVYGNGTDQAATEEDAIIRVEGMATGETLPNNVVFHVARQSWPAIGGSGSGSGADRADYWTIIAPPRYV